MEALMERMQDLLDEARRQGIAEALAAVKATKDATIDTEGEMADYLDGLQDAINTIEQM